ncbi:MAG: hypothetical protein P4N41_10015 [Negativicutes bacterium]|nr:hypothetical protein [Negativicutes bacterium]
MTLKLIRCTICQQRHIIDLTELNELIAAFSKRPVEEIVNKSCDYICSDCSDTEGYTKNYPKEDMLHAVLPTTAKVIEEA